MDLAEIFRKSLNLYKRNPSVILPHFIEYCLDAMLLVFFAIIVIILLGLSMFSGWDFSQDFDVFMRNIAMPSLSTIAFLIFGFFIVILAILLFSSLARAAVVEMARDGIEKNKTSLGTGWAGVKKFGLRIFYYQILISVISIIFFIIALIPLGLGLAKGGDSPAFLAVAIFFIIIIFIFFLIIYAALLFTPQQIVLRDSKLIEGLKESYWYVRGNILNVIIYGVVAVGVSILGILLSTVLFLPIETLSGSSLARVSASIFQNLASVVIGLLIAPYFEIVKTYMVSEDNTDLKRGDENEG